jgi:hypothetical protein
VKITALPKDAAWEHGGAADHMWDGGRVDLWAIGEHDGQTAWIQLDGEVFLGHPYKGHLRTIGVLLSASQIPAMPDDMDLPGWDAWAATIRERIANGMQMTIPGVA